MSSKKTYSETPNPLESDRQALLADLENGLRSVNQQASKYRRIHIVLAVLTTSLGLLATLLAGDSATSGDIIAEKTAALATDGEPTSLPTGWKIVCGIVAICTFLSTASSALDRLLKITEHRTLSMECAGTLDSLRLSLQSSSNMSKQELEKIRTSYSKKREQAPEYFR